MLVEVWRKRFLRPCHLVKQGLNLFMHEGQAYATWKSAPLIWRDSLRLPVSDQLAFELLGARREPCPYIGKKPSYKLFSGGDGYHCTDKSRPDETCMTVVYCKQCGYLTSHDGNPRLERALGHDDGSPIEHPVRTRLVAERDSGEFAQAAWSDDKLVPAAGSSGKLIICLHRIGETTVPRGLLDRFPSAQELANLGHYTVLREPVTAPARPATAS